MDELHQTAEWKNILISEMDNKHLVNTIRLVCKKLKNSYEVLQNIEKEIYDEQLDRSEVLDYRDEAKIMHLWYIIWTKKRFKNYIFEAQLRGIDVWPILVKYNIKEIYLTYNKTK